jgi:hypothetical protein
MSLEQPRRQDCFVVVRSARYAVDAEVACPAE